MAVLDRVVMFVSVGTPAEMATQLRELAARVESGETINDAWPRCASRPSGVMSGEPHEEPTYGRYYGVFADGEGAGTPVAMFQDRERATAYVDGKPVTLADEDGHIGADYAVCRVDIAGSVWNSYDDDPHEEVAT